MFHWSTRKLKSTPNFSSPTLPIGTIWSKTKEDSQMKDVNKLFNSKKKYVKETINHL